MLEANVTTMKYMVVQENVNEQNGSLLAEQIGRYRDVKPKPLKARNNKGEITKESNRVNSTK